jgi:hypothetical protein
MQQEGSCATACKLNASKVPIRRCHLKLSSLKSCLCFTVIRDFFASEPFAPQLVKVVRWPTPLPISTTEPKGLCMWGVRIVIPDSYQCQRWITAAKLRNGSPHSPQLMSQKHVHGARELQKFAACTKHPLSQQSLSIFYSAIVVRSNGFACCSIHNVTCWIRRS